MDAWLEQDRVWSRRRSRGSSWLAVALAACVIGIFAVIAAWIALALLQEGKSSGRSIVHVSLLRPPPPPVPPPPKEKPPEPEVKREIPVPQPKLQAAPKAEERNVPPAAQTGLDTDRVGPPNSYDLAARPGGSDITIGDSAAGSRAKFAWFIGQVQDEIQSYLHQNERLRRVNYRAAVGVWFNPDGSVARFQLFDSSDNPEVDRELSSAMSAMPRLHQPPPSDLPQPVKLRITSRGAG